MTSHALRLPVWLDPLIAEAKRRTRRRRLLVLLVLVAAVGAAVAALELPSGSGFGSGLAAVEPKPVVHVVMEWPPTSVSFDLKTGHRTGGVSREEMWIDRKNGRERIAHTEDGREVGDQVWTNHFPPTSEAAAVDHVYLSLVSSYRAALQSGAATLVGRGTFRGHHVYWLHLRQPTVPPWRHGHAWPQVSNTAVGVDAHTFKPVILRFRSSRGKSGGYYGRVVRAKAIAYNPADFKSHGPRHPRPPHSSLPRALHSARPAPSRDPTPLSPRRG
jgi:hypothetical protein